jgi:hypothetical protein
MKNTSVVIASAMLAIVILPGVTRLAKSQSQAPSSSGPSAPAHYKPSAAVKSKTMSSTPGKTAKQKAKRAAIGQGKSMVDTGNPNNSFWVEEIDLDGTGKVTEAQMLWDGPDKVLYIYTGKTFKCTNGGSADSNLLIATYGAGNTAKKPAGSGWWVAGLDENQCDVKAEGLYGCRFNQNGVNTSCGLADLNDKTHELTIIETTSR